MRKLFVPLVLVGSLALIWCSWELHFWTSPGRIIYVRSWKFDRYDFELWQQKNHGWAEAFSTVLFVRPQSNHLWAAFSIGFDDCYSPEIRLRKEVSTVEVYRGRKRLGVFDLSSASYLRVGQKESISEGTTVSPRNWWISPETAKEKSH